MTIDVEMKNNKIFIEGVELARISRRFSEKFNRDIVTMKYKQWNLGHTKISWTNIMIDTHGDYTVKSDTEINQEIFKWVKLLMEIITHFTRGDLGGLYPTLESLNMMDFPESFYKNRL